MPRSDLQEILEEAVVAAGAPGAGAAVLEDNEIVAAAAGLADAVAGTVVTTKTAFQVGSITKAFTATLAMQLIDERRFTLETTLPQLLPGLRTRCPAWTAKVRVRDILRHTPGIDGDLIVDTGEHDDYLERFVRRCDDLGFIHRPGAFFSYCNVGYILLGRAIETLRSACFDAILQHRLLEPLDLRTAQTRMGRYGRGDLARGHTRAESGWKTVDFWPRSNTPSGSRLAVSPADLVRFARFHLEAAEGRSALLSGSAARTMRRRAVATPYSLRNRAWGLGWMRFDWGGKRLFGHDGGVAGTSSFLRISPEAGFALALCVNGPDYSVVYERLMRRVLGERLRIEAPPPKPKPLAEPLPDKSRFIGRYERLGLFVEISEQGGQLMVRNGGEFGDPTAPLTPLIPISEAMFVTRLPGASADTPLALFEPDHEGRPSYAHFFDRAYSRVLS